MDSEAEPFVHVLLFECPKSRKPISSAIATGERNLEDTDGRLFAIRCECGWNGNRMGVSAKRHWIDERS